MNVLFVCSRNRLRSPTAEAVFADRAETASAGTAPDAEVVVGDEHIAWADLIVVMEGRHRRHLQRRHGAALRSKRLVCVDIPDRFELMDPELVEILERRVAPLLR